MRNHAKEERLAVAALNQSWRVRNVRVKMPIITPVVMLVESGGFSRLLIVGISAPTKISCPSEITQSCQAIKE